MTEHHHHDHDQDHSELSETELRVRALETILTEGSLPSRREHETDVNKTALDTIMGEVDELSRGH